MRQSTPSSRTTSVRGAEALGAVAAVGALALACLAAAPAVASTTPAAPTAPAVSTALPAVSQYDLSTVDLPPSELVQVTDEAVYFTDMRSYPQALDQPLLMRRSLTAGPSGTSVGPVTAVGTMAAPFVYEAHDGSVAFVRASDRNVVIVDASGTATVPTWAGPSQFTYGVLDLNDAWIAGDGFVDGAFLATIYNRQTGAAVPLEELTPDAGCTSLRVGDIVVSETRAVWTARCWNETTTAHGIYTVALDPTVADGAVGSVTQVAAASHPSSSNASTNYHLLDTDTDLIAWERWESTGTSVTSRTLQWQRSAPYTGTPAQRVLDDATFVVGVDGTVLIMNEYQYVAPYASRTAWYDLAGAATTPVRTVDLVAYGHADAATARFVVWSGGTSWGYRQLADVTGGTLTAEAPPTHQFSDVRPADPFSDDITWLDQQGITGGYADGTFRPLASVNRDAMAAFLYRMIHGGLDAPDCATAAFADVPASHPFCGEIAWLAATGITTGYPDGTFRPSAPVTREAMAAFLYRTGIPSTQACTSAPFTDVATSHPFCPEITFMSVRGVSTGWPDGTFRPGLTIERQAMAAFLHRFAGGV